jgi:hypothetical protein
METQLSEPLKAILLKVAMELKNLRWKSNSNTNEINVFQGHLEMFKNFIWQGDGEVPDVEVDMSIDVGFSRNEQNNVYFIVYNTNYNLYVQNVGGSDKHHNTDIDVPFTEQDLNNVVKFKEAAKKINDQTIQLANNFAYEYSQESNNAHQNYKNNGGWKEPEDNF